MASLWKHPNSPFWTACYVGADGRREKRSTKFRERNAAMKTALEWEKLAKSGRENRLTEVQARRVVSDIVETVTGIPLHFHSTRHWLDEWLAGKTGTTSDGTLTRYRQVIADFVAFLGDRAELPLPSISPADVRSYRDKLAREGRAPSTVNLQIKKVLNVPFSSAQKLGYIPLNPCGAVEALRSRASEREIFTPDQVRAIVAAAEGDWRGVVLCGYYTGLRLGDVCGLRWESVDLDAGILRVQTTKTGAPVVAPIHPDFEKWLRGQRRGIGKAYVFPTLAEKRTGGAGGLSAQFAKLIKRAGIVRKILRKRQGAGHETASLSFHSFRHTFVSALANEGIAADVRQRLAGHADAKVHARYTHHELDALRAAVAVLPSVGGTAR